MSNSVPPCDVASRLPVREIDGTPVRDPAHSCRSGGSAPDRATCHKYDDTPRSPVEEYTSAWLSGSQAIPFTFAFCCVRRLGSAEAVRSAVKVRIQMSHAN